METLERGFWFSYTPEEQEEEAGYVRSALQVKTILWWGRNLKSITESQHWTACRQQNAIQSSEWTIASLDYDQAMSGPTGSGQRYFADQMLTLNEDCVFVVHDGRNLSCSERKSYSAYGTTPPPSRDRWRTWRTYRTGRLCRWGGDRGFVWGEGTH